MASQDAPNGTNGAGPEKKGALKSVFGAPKALGKGVGKGVMSVGTGVTKGVTMVGGAAVDGVGTVGRGAVGITGAVAGGTVAGIGAVAGTAISGVGAVAGGAKNAIGSMPGMGHLKDDPKNSARGELLFCLPPTSQFDPAGPQCVRFLKLAANFAQPLPSTRPLRTPPRPRRPSRTLLWPQSPSPLVSHHYTLSLHS